MIVIPAIDLKDGLCVRLRQGRKSDMTVYNEDPVAVAKQFASDGAEMIHLVDLDGALNEADSPNRVVVNRIIDAIEVPIEFGGGIRTVAEVQKLREAGVARVVLGTVAAESLTLLKDFVKSFSSMICAGIDARGGYVMTRGWQSSTSLLAVDLARAVAECDVERIVYTDIARDGTLSGPNVEQTLAVARSANICVTASGGVSTLDDIKRLRDAGDSRLDSVIVGKALYDGRFKLQEALRVAN